MTVEELMLEDGELDCWDIEDDDDDLSPILQISLISLVMAVV